MKKVLVVAAACCASAVLSAGPAMASSSYDASGSSQGTSQLVTTDPNATCNPQNPTAPSDYYCEFSTTGTWTGTAAGTGLPSPMTYTGTTLVDYTTYGQVVGHEGEGCAYVSGTEVFHFDHAVLRTVYGSDSYVCETTTANMDSTHLVLDVAGGNKHFAGATGSITSEGTSTYSGTPGIWNDSATTGGSVTC